jgi:hypothetical protein
LLPKQLKHLKREKILALRSSIKDGIAKCQLFEVPVDFYSATFTGFKLKSKVVTFEEYAQGRQNYEFLKEFNALNLHSACVTIVNQCGDEININRGFLGMEDLEDL